MAVQKSRKSRAKRGTRRAHNALKTPAFSHDTATGEVHLRHHITPDGFYKGKEIIEEKFEDKTDEE